MQVTKLEDLSARLHRLRDRLATTSLSPDTPLDEDNELVQAAWECEFMLPKHLTVGTLTETVNHKIDNVQLLLERAHKHEDLPESVQVVAEQEYMATEEDIVANRHDTNSSRNSPPPF